MKEVTGKLKGKLKYIIPFLFLFSFSGCGSLFAFAKTGQPIPYAGVMMDACALTDMAKNSPLGFPFWTCDALLSGAIDTAMLPISLPYAFLNDKFYWMPNPSGNINGIVNVDSDSR